jgi:hypothetical protein
MTLKFRVANLKSRQGIVTIDLLNSRTVKVFASCRTAVLRLVIFTVTLEPKNLKFQI